MKPTTFTVKNSAGQPLTAQEIIQGAIDTIATNDPVAYLSKGPLAKPILDDNAQVARIRYFKQFYVGTQSETAIYNSLKGGNSVTAQDVVMNEINIDLDAPRTTKPEIIKSQDAQALQLEFANRFNGYMNSALRERAITFFEALRVNAKENSAKGDGITRVVDTTSVTDEVDLTKILINSHAELTDHFSDIFGSTTGDAIGIDPSLIIGVFKNKIKNKIEMTLAFTGSDKATAALTNGVVGELADSEVIPYGGLPDGIDGYWLVRGANQSPIANIEEVRDVVGNFTKQWLRWDACSQASANEGRIFDYVIAFGDPAKINA